MNNITMFLFSSLLAVSLSKLCQQSRHRASSYQVQCPQKMEDKHNLEEVGHGQCLECSLKNKMFLEPLTQMFRIKSEL